MNVDINVPLQGVLCSSLTERNARIFPMQELHLKNKEKNIFNEFVVIMKSNEAPEKIYLQENTTTDCYGEFWPEWFEARAKDSDIEYIRKDAFIKKAYEYLEPILTEYAGFYVGDDVLEHFVKYMEGD